MLILFIGLELKVSDLAAAAADCPAMAPSPTAAQDIVSMEQTFCKSNA